MEEIPGEARIEICGLGYFLLYVNGERVGDQEFVQITSSMSPDEIMRKTQLAQTLKYSSIIVSTVPVLCLYPLVQKHFVKGIMIGSVKG